MHDEQQAPNADREPRASAPATPPPSPEAAAPMAAGAGAAARGLVLVAVWSSALVGGMLIDEGVTTAGWVAVQGLLVAVTAVPLLFWRHGGRFRRACLVGSGILFAAGVLGAVTFLFVYLPSSMLLLSAARAHSQRRPWLTRELAQIMLALWLLVLLLASAAGLPAFYRAHLASPNALCVELQRTASGDDYEAFRRRVGGMAEARPGTAITIGDQDQQIEVVFFRAGSTSPDKARLEERFRTLPDVGHVERCRFH